MFACPLSGLNSGQWRQKGPELSSDPLGFAGAPLAPPGVVQVRVQVVPPGFLFFGSLQSGRGGGAVTSDLGGLLVACGYGGAVLSDWGGG